MDLGGVSAAVSSNSGHNDKAAEHLWRGNFKAHKLSKSQNLLFGLHWDKYTKLTSHFFSDPKYLLLTDLSESAGEHYSNLPTFYPPLTARWSHLRLTGFLRLLCPTWAVDGFCRCSLNADSHTDLWIVERTPLSSGFWEVKDKKKKKRVAFIFWFRV